MIRAVLLVLVLASTGLCYQADSSKKSASPEPYADPEAYQVYTAILWPDETAGSTPPKKILILAETAHFMMCLKPDPESEKIMRAALDDYRQLDGKSLVLQPDFQAGRQYEFITRAELDPIFKQGGWEAFRKKYPDSSGYTQLSPVGFNADKTIAVVYVSHSCGPLCGAGGFQILEKKNGKWQHTTKWKGQSCGWIS
ncbi:MAG TPA: hypothetical protein VFC63_03095 [Blastocatellia bacterium]|nr:hypothetical protein [Blastocatellia bacterium]